MNNLFQLGDFTLASGAKANWKIDCDALTDDDWEALAVMAVGLLPPFGSVVGVPSGGIPFAYALRQYTTEGPLLIVDDVWTSGDSWRKFRDYVSQGNEIGIVVFTRNPINEPNVRAIFSMGES